MDKRVLVFSLLCPTLAFAKAQTELYYRMEEVFSTATRFVRVDRGCTITDKDADAAFVVFECPTDDKKVSRGGLEIFRTNVRGRDGVRVQISLSDEPHGVELRWLELFERKLREERGAPIPPPKPDKPPEKTPPDAGGNFPAPF